MRHYSVLVITLLAPLLILAVGCFDAGETNVSSTTSVDRANERPEMQTTSRETQVDRGINMELTPETRRDPPQ